MSWRPGAPAWGFSLSSIGDGEKLTLLALWSFARPPADGDDRVAVWPSRDSLSGLTGKSERTLRRHLATLSRAGLVRVAGDEVLLAVTADGLPPGGDDGAAKLGRGDVHPAANVDRNTLAVAAKLGRLSLGPRPTLAAPTTMERINLTDLVGGPKPLVRETTTVPDQDLMPLELGLPEPDRIDPAKLAVDLAKICADGRSQLGVKARCLKPDRKDIANVTDLVATLREMGETIGSQAEAVSILRTIVTRKVRDIRRRFPRKVWASQAQWVTPRRLNRQDLLLVERPDLDPQDGRGGGNAYADQVSAKVARMAPRELAAADEGDAW
ncbi:MAG TPA: helix-turn-helix domain-containing protein [Acidimicrobiia bacterium]